MAGKSRWNTVTDARQIVVRAGESFVNAYSGWLFGFKREGAEALRTGFLRGLKTAKDFADKKRGDAEQNAMVVGLSDALGVKDTEVKGGRKRTVEVSVSDCPCLYCAYTLAKVAKDPATGVEPGYFRVTYPMKLAGPVSIDESRLSDGWAVVWRGGTVMVDDRAGPGAKNQGKAKERARKAAADMAEVDRLPNVVELDLDAGAQMKKKLNDELNTLDRDPYVGAQVAGGIS
ncbi:hypothetical protein LQD23_00840 [Chromobacterium violaceum]|uniref:hypothetical protein n=1 Tax=Chromobacterium violaceum TaxID=536 RepID=UPI001E334273|nr:hypothetical protein [Chromobacterium violaceum]MCD0490845.1 hypothetical protein [Chromobacterium violaceum]